MWAVVTGEPFYYDDGNRLGGYTIYKVFSFEDQAIGWMNENPDEGLHVIRYGEALVNA